MSNKQIIQDAAFQISKDLMKSLNVPVAGDLNETDENFTITIRISKQYLSGE